MLRSKTVVKVHKGKSPLCQPHSIELVLFLASINPASSMDTDNRFLRFCYLFLMINIEQIVTSVWSVGNIVKSHNILRRGKSFISLVITDFPDYPEIPYLFT